MKIFAIILGFTLGLSALPFSAVAEVFPAASIQSYTSVQSGRLNDPGLIKIEKLARQMIGEQKMTKHADSCGEVLTFKGPKAPAGSNNQNLWIQGIANELIALDMDENIRLARAPLNYNDLRLKVTLLADRDLAAGYEIEPVERLAKSIFFLSRKDLENYHLFFGDYLDTNLGWATALVLVKIDQGEALFLSNAGRCH